MHLRYLYPSSSLSIRGGAASWGLMRLATRLVNLNYLGFHDIWSLDYKLVVEALPNPHLVEHLRFDSGGSHLEVLLPGLLPRFPALRSLEVTNITFRNLAPELGLVLQESHISHLLLAGTNLSADSILSLLSGPRRMRTLKTLTLDGYWEADPGPPFDRWQPVQGLSAEICSEQGHDVAKMEESWMLSEWGEGMEGRAEKVVEAAKKNGIEVDGMVLEGIEMDKEYKQEKEKLEKLIEEDCRRTAWLQSPE
jgi:hypothetical protein